MKRLLLALAASTLLLASAAHAAKGDKKKGDNVFAELVKKFDANANGKIDKSEFEAVRKAFAETADLNLKGLDKDNDGKLSDAEIEALNTAAPTKTKKKK